MTAAIGEFPRSTDHGTTSETGVLDRLVLLVTALVAARMSRASAVH